MKLKKINLMRATEHPEGGFTNHPDISLRKWYLVKHGGNFSAGKFSREWYGLNFDDSDGAGLEFDKPGTNGSDWEGCWEIIR
jgi:hypothetical protein